MSEQKHGGPAFPCFETIDHWDSDSEKYRETIAPVGGMTLRDYFAGQALVGITSALTHGIRPSDIEELALDCYGIADKLLAEREKDGA